MNKPGGYVDINQLQAETTLEEAAAECGVALGVKGTGKEVRIDCPFGCAGDHPGRKEISINTENPQKVFMCHAYQCGFRGNLLSLMHGWLTGAKPAGGKLKGEEFHRVCQVLVGRTSPPQRPASVKPVEKDDSPTPQPARNAPLVDSAETRIRELHNIDEKFITDVAAMNPAAAAYLRRHPCLTSESMKKWRCGYLPNDGGGDKRGFSMRGSIVYSVLSVEGKVLTWVARDVRYEEREREWSRLAPAERAGKEMPAKHRFPKGFHRGVELFGQQATRLREAGYREQIARYGIIVVEGFNDVIGLDNLGIPAVGIMSNRVTNEQGETIAKWSKQFADGRVTLMFDCEASGVEGAKEALWFFAQRELDARLAWTPAMYGGQFAGRQPETITSEEWQSALRPWIERQA